MKLLIDINKGTCDLMFRSINEIERELRMRANVYPSLIRSGRLSEANATRQTEDLERALLVLKEVQAAITNANEVPSLFDQ